MGRPLVKQLRPQPKRLLVMDVGRYISLFLVVLAACPEPTGTRPQEVAPTSTEVTIRHDSRQPPPSIREEPTILTSPPPGEVVYYRLHPDFKKVDKYCGAFDRSYVVEPVEIPPGEQAVLTRALEALFREYWELDDAVRSVRVDESRAVVDLRSSDGLGFASTSCGGVGFLGSLMRTVFQFDSVDHAQVRLEGSCARLGKLLQYGRCLTFTRDDIRRGTTH